MRSAVLRVQLGRFADER